MGDKFIFNAQLESVDQLWFPQLGVSYPLLANWRLGLNYEMRFGSAGLCDGYESAFLGKIGGFNLTYIFLFGSVEIFHGD